MPAIVEESERGLMLAHAALTVVKAIEVPEMVEEMSAARRTSRALVT
jgi:hypothetical protein